MILFDMLKQADRFHTRKIGKEGYTRINVANANNLKICYR